MARATKKATTSRTRATKADSTPLVDPLTYTDGVGFEAGNAAAADKFRTVDGKVVDDLKGEQGWQIVVKGDRVTPAIAREIAGDDTIVVGAVLPNATDSDADQADS